MSQQNRVDAGFAGPQHLELLGEGDFTESADGQAGQRDSELNARNHATQVSQQRFDDARTNAAAGHELANAREAHGDEREFRGGEETVERNQRQHAKQTHYEHSSERSPPAIVTGQPLRT